PVVGQYGPVPRTRQTSREVAEPAPIDSAATTDGVSQFITKVLNQLSLSAWLPSALFVGTAFLLLEVHSQKVANIGDAITALTNKTLGTIIVLVFALVLGTMITQAFEFAAIRCLEGYWPPFASRLGVTGALVRYQMWRAEHALSRLNERTRKAFRAAREEMHDQGISHDIVKYLQRVAYGEMEESDVSDEVKAAA